MARGRMIDKVVILSKKVNAISEGAENLYYRVNISADDYGHYHAEPEILKGQIYTLRKIGLKEIARRIDELWRINLIKLYEASGERYLEIIDFEKHQTFKSDRPKKAEFPEPKGYLKCEVGGQPAPGGIQLDSNGSLSKDNLSKVKLREDRTPEPDGIQAHKRIKFNWKTNQWEGITEEDKKLWREAYPACDIEIELKRWIVWALANPQKAKKSNYLRSINYWLSQEQQRGGTKGTLQAIPKKSATEQLKELERQRNGRRG